MRFLNLISWYYDFYVGFVWTCLITLVSGLKILKMRSLCLFIFGLVFNLGIIYVCVCVLGFSFCFSFSWILWSVWFNTSKLWDWVSHHLIVVLRLGFFLNFLNSSSLSICVWKLYLDRFDQVWMVRIVEKEIKLKFQNFNFSVILIHKNANSIRSKIYVISLFFFTYPLCSIWIMKRISTSDIKCKNLSKTQFLKQ